MNIGASRSPLFGKAVLEVRVPAWQPLMPLGDAYRAVVIHREDSPQALLTIERNRFTGFLKEMQFVQTWREVKEKAEEIPDDIKLTLQRDSERSRPNAAHPSEQFMVTVTKSEKNPKNPRRNKLVDIMTLTQKELGGPKYQVWSTALSKVKAYLDTQAD